MNQQIKTVVFDLGRVLIDFTFEPFAQLMRDRGATFSSLQDLAAQVNMFEHEKGNISTSEFVDNALSLLSIATSREELIHAWTNIFTPHNKMLALAQSLKSKHTVCILSNTSELHWDFLKKNYPLENSAHHLCTSFELRAMKPDPIIYRAVEKRTQSKPEQILFFDDMPDNNRGAQDCGWNAAVHTTFEETKQVLKEYGVVA